MNNDSTNFHNIMDNIERDCKVKKVKESILLLKQKMHKTNDLIQHYSNNVKEIEYLKSNLESVKKEGKHTITSYKSALDKIRELELKNIEEKQKNEKLINKIDEYEINFAANKQTIQQLTCKIEQMEEEHSVKIMEYSLQESSFEEKIKSLEHELKKLKATSVSKKKEKKIISTDFDTAKSSISTKSSSDIGINISLCDNKLGVRCEVKDKGIMTDEFYNVKDVKCEDKSIMTDEFYNMKDDPYPLFCAKCEAHLSPDVTPEKICKTMSAYPKIIEQNLSPLSNNIFSPCSLPSTYLESTNRNEDALSRISMPQLSPYSPYSDSIINNPKSQSEQSSVMAQICEKVKLKNMDISRIPVVANLAGNPVSTSLILPQSRNCERESFCSDDLLVKHSSSIKEMERKIQLLESKMKKIRRLKERVDNNSCCHRSVNCKDDISLNSNLISIMCKSMAEYYDGKRETCSKKKRDIDSEMYACTNTRITKLKRKRLNKSNEYKSIFSDRIKKRERYRNMFYNNTENAKKAIDILQYEHALSVHKNHSVSDINISSTSLNHTDESDRKKYVLHEISTLHSAEVASVEDSLTTSRLNAEIYASNNPLDKGNIETVEMDNQMETGTIFLSNSEHSTKRLDKIVDINAEKNETKNKGENVHENTIGKICTSNNFSNKNNVKTIDMDNQTKTVTTFLSKDETVTDHADDKININAESSIDYADRCKIVDINEENITEKNIIKSKAQNIHKDKIGEISSGNFLNKDNTEAIDVGNQIKTESTSLSKGENCTDHADGKIVNAEKQKINKGQSIHKDNIGEVYSSNNFLNEGNIEAIDMGNQITTERTFLSKNKNCSDHADDKIVDIQAEKQDMRSKGQNIHKDNIGEVYSSNNFLNKDNIEAIDMDNQAATERTFLSKNENCSDHAHDKIIDIQAEKQEKISKSQNIHKDNTDEVYSSNNFLNKGNIEAIDMGNQIATERTFLSKNKNCSDYADGEIINNAEKHEIKNKDRNIYNDQIDENKTENASDNLLSKNNIKTIDMSNQTKIIKPPLSKNKNYTDHADGKIINAEKPEVRNKGQNIHKDKIGEIYASDNFLSKDNIEATDMDNQIKTRKTSLFKVENSTDSKITDINTEEGKIERKGRNVCKNKVGDRILKKLRSLKRKTCATANSHMNKQEIMESLSNDSFEYDELPKKSRIENEEKSGTDCSKSIINLKKNLNIESINKQEDNKLCSDDYEPTKKLRIAHTPKTTLEVNTNEDTHSTHSTIRSIATLMTRKNNRNLRQSTRKDNLLNKESYVINKKCDEKNVKSMETNSADKRPMNGKELDSTSAKDCLQNNDIGPSATNIEHVSEYKKCDSVLIEDKINRSISIDSVIKETSNISNKPNKLHINITHDTVNDLEFKKSIPLKKCIITQSVSSTLYKDSKYDRLTEAIEIRKEMPNIELKYACKALENKSHDDHKILKDAISNDESSVVHGRSNISEAIRNESHNNSEVSYETTEVPYSQSPRDSGILDDYTNDTNMKESFNEIKNTDKRGKTRVNDKTIKVQTVKKQRKNVCVSKEKEENKEIKFVDVPEEVEGKFQSLESRIIKYVNQNHTKNYKLTRKRTTNMKIADKFIKKQLRKLINSAWEDNMHDVIVRRLKNICGPRIIAKCTLEFLLKEVDHTEALDKSFTPPAPMLTTYEQKIILLLIDLEVSKPKVIYFIQAAIEYTLFRLTSKVWRIKVTSLTRIYVSLSRIQKDREKIRMMCCDALYSSSLKSIHILHTILTSWPEVLPNAEANTGILPRCIAFLIGTQPLENLYLDMQLSVQKLSALKMLILKYYKYVYTEETKNNFVKELMTALKVKRIDGLDTAIMLVAKREGPSWTYMNIIRSDLLPMIIKNEHPCIYSAFFLLGKLLRAFLPEDEGNIVKDIIEQLCDLIKSGQGSHDQQEGIVSALLSLSRCKFNIVAPFVIKWMPSKLLRPTTNVQLQGFINLRNFKFWKGHLSLDNERTNNWG